MPDKRFDMVRKRLQWAKKIHVFKGIIGRESDQNTMRQLIEFYRSNQWQTKGAFGDLPSDVLRVVNKVFPIANRQQAGIAARNPRVQYFPRTKDSEAKAPHVELLHNYDIREQNHIAQMKAAFRDAQFAPFPGVLRHGYTPERELLDENGKALFYFRPANPNRPWIKRSAPWDTLIDPRAESWHMDGGAQWCAFRSVMTLDQVKRNPNMIAREQLKDFKGNVTQAYRDMMPRELHEQEDPDRESYVEVWTVYDLEDRTWMQLTLDGVDDWLRKPEEWPIAWEWLPINTFIVNPQIDTPYPKSLMEDMIPLQQELNQIRTMMSVLTRSMRAHSFYDENKVDETAVTLLKDSGLLEYFPVKGNPAEVMHQLKVGGLPQELMLYADTVMDDMRESVGLSRFARARRENVESATEAAAITQGQDVIEGRTQEAFDLFVRETEMTYMQGRRSILATVGGRESLRVLGQEGAQALASYVTVDAETLAGEFEFEVEAGSTRPKDLEREAQLAAVDMQVLSPLSFSRQDELARRYLELRRLDPARFMRAESTQAADLESAAAFNRGVGLEGGETSAIDPNLASLLAGGGGAQ